MAYLHHKETKSGIENRENGISNIDNVDIGLNHLEETNRYLGFRYEKQFNTFMFMFLVVLWLPAYIMGKAISKDE